MTEHRHSNECYSIVPACPITPHRHSRACKDKDGNNVCGLFDHAHDPVNCTKSVRTCGQ